MQHADEHVAWDDPAYVEPPSDERWRPGRVAAAIYVGLAVVVSAIWLWSVSAPGWIFLIGLVALAGMLLVAVVWLVCGVVTAVRLTSGRVARPGRYLLVVPLIGLVVLALTWTRVPLRVRFEVARSQFDAYAEQVLDEAEGVQRADLEVLDPDDPRWISLNPEVPARLGSFELRFAEIRPEGLIIFDRDGAMFDDAGFAYLPEGEQPPGDGSFESPDLRSLGGDWYSFTSSW